MMNVYGKSKELAVKQFLVSELFLYRTWDSGCKVPELS